MNSKNNSKKSVTNEDLAKKFDLLDKKVDSMALNLGQKIEILAGLIETLAINTAKRFDAIDLRLDKLEARN